MTTAVSSAALPLTSISMAKTPFIRTNTSSFEDDDEETGDCEKSKDDENKKEGGVSSSGADTCVQVQLPKVITLFEINFISET